MTDLKFEGFDRIRAKLKRVSVDMPEKVLVAATRAGANVIRDRARENVKRMDDPESPEQIHKNVKAFRRKRGVPRGDIKFSIGVEGGAREYANTKDNVRKRRVGKSYMTGGSTWYWRFLEFGNEHQRATPFLVPAMVAMESAVIQKIADEAERRLDKLIAAEASSK